MEEIAPPQPAAPRGRGRPRPEPSAPEPVRAARSFGVVTVAPAEDGVAVVQRPDGSTAVIDHFAPDTSQSPDAVANNIIASMLQPNPRDPQSSTTVARMVSQLLKALADNHPLRGTLAELGKRAPTVRISAKLGDEEPGGAAAAYYPDQDLIRLDMGKILPSQRFEVLVHEMAHAVLHGSLAANPALRSTVAQVRDQVATALEQSGQPAEAAGRVRGISEQEFAALLASDPMILRLASATAPRTLMQRFFSRLAEAYGIPSTDLAGRLIRPLDWAAPNDSQRQELLTTALAQGESAPQTWTALAGVLQAASDPSHGVNPIIARLGPAANKLGLQINDRLRRLAIDALSTENIVDWFGDRFGPEGRRALQDYHDAVAGIAHRTNQLIARMERPVRALEDLAVTNPEAARDVALLMHDATLRHLHPDEPLSSSLNAYGRHRPGAQKAHEQLAERWRNLPPEVQDLYLRTRDALRDLHIDHLAALMASAMRDTVATSFGMPPSSSEAYDKALEISRVLIQTGDLSAFPKGVELSRTARTFLNRMLSFAHLVADPARGPYFPLLRTGRYFIIAGDPEMKKMTMSIDEWENTTDLDLNIDPRTEPRFDVKRGTVQFRGRYYAVHTADSEAAARQMVEELAPKFGKDKVFYQVRDEYLSSLRRQLPSEEIERILVAATEGLTPQAARTVENNLLEMLSARLTPGSFASSRITRLGVMGASRNMAQASMRQAATMARTISRLENAGRKRAALEFLRAIEKETARTNPAEGVVISEVRQSLQARDELADVLLNPFLGSTVLTKIANFTATAFLTNAATVMINLTQPWMVSFPVLAGRFGVAKSGEAMVQAMNDTVAGAIRAATLAYGRTAKGLSPLPGGVMWHDMMMDRMTPDERQMIDELVRRNRLDFTMTDDLIEMTDPMRGPLAEEPGRAGQIWRRVQDFLFIAPRLGESFNRVATALAAYRLARDHGGGEFAGHQAYTTLADDVVRLTHGNYENYNKSRFFITPYLRMMLVFKQYAYAMLFLQGWLLRQAFRKDADAIRAMGIYYGMAFAAAGAAGMVPEPVWVAMNMIARLFGWTAEEVLRQGMTALAGSDLGVAIVRGPVSTVADIDLQRMSLSETFIPGEVYRSGSLNEFLVAIVSTYFGAPGGVVQNIADGMAQMHDGQLLRGLARMFPIRVVANPIHAIDWMANGYTDRSGKPVMSPDELGWWALGIKAIGFTPQELAERGRFSAAVARETRRATVERSRIYRDLTARLIAGEDISGVMQRVAAFNAKYPSAPIDLKSLRQAFAEQMRARARLRTVGTALPNQVSREIARDMLRLYNLPETIRERAELSLGR